ncbi:maleylpyruvate isomerase family mycothiol-dependent enzyme [Antrihabitans stalactiti]|uniref:Maleylpyruvate isomerase family mycothiol-dependent enzyme n=1 Tax=Antrihabitans stalactiti TaxID=2584121 RepID=A0A848KHW7_9NOCA|nr:maleylpyruvate isomerase family mycothiol-dependent enzyme [Antrihabitans stalactiti]NMN98633.1 maleylpyruvate isomerase family mycothiol-dependent enzyme [Antrihabitans stalactiti]
MAAPSPWPIIHAERESLIADVEGLTDEQWATASLCAEWSVRDVFAHMTATVKMTPPKFVGKFARSGFNFDAMAAKDIARETAGTPADGLAEFRAHLTDKTHPPGPIDAMLGEAIIHSSDIRLPLGISHDFPTDAVVRVADFYKGSNLLIGAKNRISGLTLKATDADWSTGSGPEVSGPMLSLALAMTGRSAAVAGLTGDGVAILQTRM